MIMIAYHLWFLLMIFQMRIEENDEKNNRFISDECFVNMPVLSFRDRSYKYFYFHSCFQYHCFLFSLNASPCSQC